MRAAMKAIYELAVYHWVSDWLSVGQLEGQLRPREMGIELVRKHERLYTCGYEAFPETIRKLAEGNDAGLPPNYREFLTFMSGLCICLQAEAMKP